MIQISSTSRLLQLAKPQAGHVKGLVDNLRPSPHVPLVPSHPLPAVPLCCTVTSADLRQAQLSSFYLLADAWLLQAPR